MNKNLTKDVVEILDWILDLQPFRCTCNPVKESNVGFIYHWEDGCNLFMENRILDIKEKIKKSLDE